MTVDVRSLLLCAAFALLGACATTTTKAPVEMGPEKVIGTRTDSLADVPGVVASAQAAGPVLLVLDIDDTLLTTPREGAWNRKFFGSDRWFGWQVGLRSKPNADPRIPCLADVNGMLYESGSQVATEPDAVKLVNGLTVERLALTSRHPSNRGPTEREWFRAGYDELPMLADAKGNVVPSRIITLKPDSPMVYQRGIFMTGGGNKGEMLTELLRQLDRKSAFKTVILVDDGGSNISKMEAAMKELGIAFIGLHYLGIKKDLPRVPTRQETDEAQRDWKHYRAGLQKALPERWKRLQTGTGCSLADPH